jgi:aminocarboxymuconate-semialdehyde decarboxylase
VSRFFDVAASLAALVVAGRLEQYPDLELVAATAGGGVALIHNRIDAAHHSRPPAEGVVRTALSRSPSDYLRTVYVDTASMNRELQLANLEFMGPERMLFGTDSPPLATPLPDAIAMVDSLPISDEDRENVLAGNARRLFKLDERTAAG